MIRLRRWPHLTEESAFVRDRYSRLRWNHRITAVIVALFWLAVILSIVGVYAWLFAPFIWSAS